jgi:hypothetical protein
MSDQNYPVDHRDEAEQREERRKKADRLAFPRSTPKLEVPGSDAAFAQLGTTDKCLDPADEIAHLRRQLEDAHREMATRLLRSGTVRTAAEPVAVGATYEPISPHAAAAQAASRYMNWTAAELESAIQAGTEPHPRQNHVLCRDGWWTTSEKK